MPDLAHLRYQEAVDQGGYNTVRRQFLEEPTEENLVRVQMWAAAWSTSWTALNDAEKAEAPNIPPS